jgi:hypothetical protein
MRFLLIFAALPLLANSQSLVIVGGNEEEDNSPIWEATINQAVSFFKFKCDKSVKSFYISVMNFATGW